LVGNRRVFFYIHAYKATVVITVRPTNLKLIFYRLNFGIAQKVDHPTNKIRALCQPNNTGLESESEDEGNTTKKGHLTRCGLLQLNPAVLGLRQKWFKTAYKPVLIFEKKSQYSSSRG